MNTTCLYLYKGIMNGRVYKVEFWTLNITQVFSLTLCLVSQECHCCAFKQLCFKYKKK